VRQILALVDSGRVSPGDRLPPERELAQEFGVSRSSVREAMTALEVLGVVVIRQGSGIFIGAAARDPLLDEVSAMTSYQGPLEILEVRLLFEPGMARVAALRRNEDDLHAMKTKIDQMQADIEAGQDGWEPDWGFHQSIGRATQNPMVEAVVDLLGQRMQNPLWGLMRAHNFEDPDHARRYVQDHRAIFDAIALKQPQVAFKQMMLHIESILGDLEESEPRVQDGSGPKSANDRKAEEGEARKHP
jgi:GntR family transcriptional repressor for pyruvate dehydrogenase complex